MLQSFPQPTVEICVPIRSMEYVPGTWYDASFAKFGHSGFAATNSNTVGKLLFDLFEPHVSLQGTCHHSFMFLLMVPKYVQITSVLPHFATLPLSP